MNLALYLSRVRPSDLLDGIFGGHLATRRIGLKYGLMKSANWSSGSSVFGNFKELPSYIFQLRGLNRRIRQLIAEAEKELPASLPEPSRSLSAACSYSLAFTYFPLQDLDVLIVNPHGDE